MRRLLIFAICSIAFAQPEQAPIKVTTRLIETNVIVRDSHGPIRDLTADSFKLFDNGKPQKIAVFRVSTSEAPPNLQAAPPPLPPGVFSNRYAKAAARPARYTVLLLDTLNTDTADQFFAQKQMLAMLDSNPVKDPLAFYVLGEKFRVVQDFTSDRDLLRKAIEAFRPEKSHKLNMSYEPTPPCGGTRGAVLKGGGQSCEMMRQSFKEIRDFGNRDRALQSVEAFAELGKRLVPLAGRKSVIWISNAFPAPALRDHPWQVEMLNRADIVIYPVHARGLALGVTNPRDPTGSSPWPLGDETDALNWVADQTGGRAFYNRNDVDAAIREAIDDTEVVYTLGFYSQRDKPDGDFHALKVKVDRPGVNVRHRAGYVDIDRPSTPGEVPEDADSIGMIAAIARKGADFDVAVQVDFKDLHLESIDGRWKGSTELAFGSISASGKTLDVSSKKLTFDMTDEAYQARRREGFALEQMIPIRADTARIRVAIVDQSGAAGSVSITPPK